MSVTVQAVIDALTASVSLPPNTVDTLKTGSPEREVRKVAVVFTATYAAIAQAVEVGAELIVTHEPTYYNHADSEEGLRGDPVYEKKRALIESSGVAIFRLHDAIHRYKPDGIVAGMLEALGWETLADPAIPLLVTLPSAERHTVRTVADHLKAKLGIVDAVLVGGDPELAVNRLALIPGAPPGEMHLHYLGMPDVELVVAGEANEWVASEYVRDAADMGMAKALLVIGHQKSEEAGMRTVLKLLRESFPALETVFIEGKRAVRPL